MGSLIRPAFLLLIAAVFLGSLCTSWGGLTKAVTARLIAATGIFIQIGCALGALVLAGWQGAAVIIVVAMLAWPATGYVAAAIWVKIRPHAKLLTPQLAARLCSDSPADRDLNLEAERSETVLANLKADPDFQALFGKYGVPLCEADEVHRYLRSSCGPKTADTVMLDPRLMVAYLEYYTGLAERRHQEAASHIAADLDFPRV
jgi:hypothetical protein